MKIRSKPIRTLFILIVFLAVQPCFSEGSPRVLATNSWTAAYAAAAGVEGVEILAPADMVHPPEYELLPSDVKKVHDADFLIYAGYEVLMKSVFESFEKPEDELIRIQTGYNPELMRRSILAVAGRTGNRAEALRSIDEIEAFFRDTREALRQKGIFGVRVLVHFHQRPLAEALGFEIAGVFGPAPMEVGQLRKLGSLEPLFIIDNAHNPIAVPLAEITGAPAAELINFPGLYNDKEAGNFMSLIGVLTHNRNILLADEFLLRIKS